MVLLAGGCDSSICSKLFNSSELYDPTTGQWALTGNMVTARQGHTATLLSNGQVLVAGGCIDFACATSLAQAEIYSPTTGTWTAVASMNVPRSGHTATLLASGKVLVASGCGSAVTPCYSAEIYDPATQRWTPTQPMIYCQYRAGAALLHSGQVLVVGGYCGTGNPIAELFNPSINSWSATGNTSVGFYYNFAITLQGGEVLVSGGVTTADLYHSVPGQFKVTGSMTTQRVEGYTATLLANGTVLAAGGLGCGNACSSAEIYTPGPSPLANLSPTSLTFEPQLVGSTSPAQNLTLGNLGSRALSVGTVSVSGAQAADFATSGTCAGAALAPGASCTVSVTITPSAVGPRSASLVIQDNAPNNPHKAPLSAAGYLNGSHHWQPAGQMSMPRQSHTATVLNDGRVLAAGGFSDDLSFTALASADLYDPISDQWSSTGSMNVARGAHTGTKLGDGRVLVAGGGTRIAELYDPATGAWTTTGSMHAARSSHTATLLTDGKVLVAGGCSVPSCVTAELYDPAAGTWTPTATMQANRNMHTATLLPDGKVLVAGGQTLVLSDYASAELYDPGTGTWSLTGSMLAARDSHTATLLPGGTVLVAGGEQVSPDGTTILRQAEIYDPASGIWKATGSMSVPRYAHTATSLRKGSVLVAGGQNVPGGESGIGATSPTVEI
jgi:N-acetylneuraminic acid mutarotase